MPKLFVYGTLKDSNIQKEVLRRTVELEPANLTGFEISQVKIEGETFPALIPGNSNIAGFVIDVTESELVMLDQYETDIYERVKISLDSGLQAFTYVKHN